jgi:genome maintenance exonuclease 1
MMSEEDIKEYHNIGRAIKHNDKYTYVDSTRIEEHGSRLYDVNGARLPSVTTILGKTKDQQFIKDWKAKVGEQEAERIKNLSSNRGTAMHKFLEHHIT